MPQMPTAKRLSEQEIEVIQLQNDREHEESIKQQSLPVAALMSLENRETISLDALVAVEKQTTQAYIAAQNRFSIVAMERIDSKFGPRVVVSAVLPDDTDTTWVFTQTLGAGKLGRQREALLAAFERNSSLVVSDACLVPVATNFGNDGYMLTSTRQRDEGGPTTYGNRGTVSAPPHSDTELDVIPT